MNRNLKRVLYNFNIEDDMISYNAGVYNIVNNGNYMLEAIGPNKFSDEMIPIPRDAKYEELSDNQKEYYCREVNPKPNFNGLEILDWKENVRNECLTINDILSLGKGEKIDVLIMDRNLSDWVCSVNEYNTLYKAENFFRTNKATYIHNHDLTGKIIWEEGDLNSEQPFEFHIEYQKDHWYPLKNNFLPKEDPQKFAFFSYPEDKHYMDFNDKTRVGWRGPMLLWSKMKNQPDIYYYKE